MRDDATDDRVRERRERLRQGVVTADQGATLITPIGPRTSEVGESGPEAARIRHGSSFEGIDGLCVEFDDAWATISPSATSAGPRRPTIEGYIEKVAEAGRTTLLRNLLRVEIDRRRAVGERPRAEDYLGRFPQFGDLIRRAFAEPATSRGFVLDETDRQSVAISGRGSKVRRVPTADRLGDYRLLAELGRGGMGVVYEATHMGRGTRVALKTLPLLDGERLHRFKREFRSVSEVNHPNLVGLHTLEADGCHWFFTMDLVAGTDIASHCWPGGVFDEARLRAALPQLCTGVAAFHERRLVHRDLKPSNVMVATDGRVVILDFGLALELAAGSAASTLQVAGTPAYMAPEQAAGRDVTAAADWYAVGATLYEALSGRPPFSGPVLKILRDKQEVEPPPLPPGAPADLAALALRLMAREPAARPGASEIAGALAGRPAAVAAGHRTGTPAGDLPFVGRESHLDQLREAYRALEERCEPVAAFVCGRSGEGKTTLCENFLDPLRRDKKAVVLSGRCYDRESVPFKALDGLVDALAGHLRTLSETGQVLKQLPDDVHLLANLFPTLGRVPAVANRAKAKPQQVADRQLRYRAFFALREILFVLGRSSPVIVFVDDLQWGDADSAEILFEMFAPPRSPAVLLLGSYRSDEEAKSAFLRTWNRMTAERGASFESRTVAVNSLTPEQCRDLLAARVGLPADRLHRAAAELFASTRGNPYFLEQLLEDFDAEAERFGAAPLHEAVARKLSRLPKDAVPLLQAVATAGQAVLLDEASRVAGSDSAMFATATRMRNERLLRLVGTADRPLLDTYHDKVRETVLEQMPHSVRRGLHRRLAETIEAGEGLSADEVVRHLSREADGSTGNASARVFDLAHHFHEAGDMRAFPYQVLAGDQALHKYAPEDAAAFYARAETLMPEDAAPPLRFRLFNAAGRAFLWSKDPDRAAEYYAKSRQAAESRSDRARASAGIGAVYNQTARFDQAIRHYDDALRELGSPRAKTPIAKLMSVASKAARVLFVSPRWQRARDPSGHERALLRHEILVRLSRFIVEKDVVGSFDTFLADAAAAFRTGQPSLIAHGYAQAAFGFSAFGFGWIGNLLLRRSGRIESELNDPGSRGAFLFSRGVASYWGGDLPAAERALEQAVPPLRRCGDFYTRLISAHMVRHVRAFRGSSGAELSAAREVLELAREVGNAQCICWGEYDVASALARRGDLAGAREHMARANAALTGERYDMTEAIRGGTHGYVALQCSDYGLAREAATYAWDGVARSWVVLDVTLFCLPVLIEAVAGPNWLAPIPADDAKLLKKYLRRVTLLYLSLPNHQPHLQRACGRAEWALGRRRRAIRRLEAAVRLAREKGMDYQCARSLLDLAAVRAEGRDENRSEAVELLRKAESVIPRVERWLLGDDRIEDVVAAD